MDTMPKKQKKIKRSIIKVDLFKWKFPIKYHISSQLENGVIDKAIKLIQGETCITFEKSAQLLTNEVRIIFKYHDDSCSSHEGKKFETRPQDILLNDQCKKQIGNVFHELAHALGLHHEHTRRDRDNYVKIIKENVEKHSKPNFYEDLHYNSQTFGISYDLGSIMHYELYAFSDNDEATVVPLDENYNETIGQQVSYTFNDIKLLNYLYCNDTCSNPDTSLKCQNYGYLDPRNCSQCKCPHGFAGSDCTILQPQSDDEKCGTHYFNATSTKSTLTKSGIMNCTFLIKSENAKVVDLTIKNMIANPAPDPDNYLHCFSGMALEIKHKIDTSVTGLCLCDSITEPIHITSEGNQIFIMWYGKEENHTFTLEYKEVDKKQN